MTQRTWLWILLPMALLEGCASTFGCKGFPNSPICKSAMEAYKATDGAKVENPMEAQNLPLDSARSGDPKGHLAGLKALPKMIEANAVRTPPKVMRIWIAPFEDSDGDLQVGGFVFTELEARRWLIGQPGGKGHPALRPLQVTSRKEAHPETFAVKAESSPLKSPEPQPSGIEVEEPTYD